MNYSKLSDFEINKRVAEKLGYIDVSKEPVNCIGVRVNKSSTFAYCNNPSDAWPIIVENSISLTKQSTSPGANWHADIIESIIEDAGDEDSFTCKTLFHCHDKNPLRAAMIVYLIMQEENDSKSI